MPRRPESQTTGLTPQQEIFCREYVRLGVGAAAYRLAYNVGAKTKPQSIWVNASKLLADAKVQLRVQALMDRAMKATDVTADFLVRDLLQTKEIARHDGQHSSAVSATMGVAKITGHAIDRAEIGGPNGTPIPLGITDDAKNFSAEQRAAVRGALAALAAKPRAGAKGARRS